MQMLVINDSTLYAYLDIAFEPRSTTCVPLWFRFFFNGI